MDRTFQTSFRRAADYVDRTWRRWPQVGQCRHAPLFSQPSCRHLGADHHKQGGTELGTATDNGEEQCCQCST